MSDMMMASVGLAAINTALALVVGVVYFRNWRELRSAFTLALGLFAFFLVVHNGMIVYHYVAMMPTFSPLGEQFVFVESLLQLAGLAALTYATWR